MMVSILRNKALPAERLLGLREKAGADQLKHDYYHKVVGRYQQILLRTYIKKHRFRWFWMTMKKKIPLLNI